LGHRKASVADKSKKLAYRSKFDAEKSLNEPGRQRTALALIISLASLRSDRSSRPAMVYSTEDVRCRSFGFEHLGDQN
jgi:hypothetical protein